MSIEATNWAWSIPDLTPAAKLVLLRLADRLNEHTKKCMPKVESIAKDCGISMLTVTRSLKELRNRGLIKSRPRYRFDGRQTANWYDLQIPNHQNVSSAPHHYVSSYPPQNVSSSNPNSESEYESFKTASEADAEDHLKYKEIEEDKKEKLEIENKIGEEKEKNCAKKEKEIADMKMEDFVKECGKGLTVESAIDRLHKKKDSYSSTTLYGLWKDLNIVFNHQTFFVSPPAKMLGQLGQLGKKFPRGGEVELENVMVAVVRDWIGFGKFLKDQGQVSDFPDKPVVGWFLKYAEFACQFYQKPFVPQTKKGGLKVYSD